MNVSTEKFSDYLKPFLLQTVAVCTDTKIIRRGKLKIFQIKQHYAKLTLEDDVRTRQYEIPYPFEMIQEEDKLTLSYKLDKFLSVGDLEFQSKFLDSSKRSKLYNTDVYIMPLDNCKL